MATGLIFDIKKYAINDGPGIRLTVFFKGCSLACQWCHNPESMTTQVQKMYTASKCIGAATCIDNCPNEALTMSGEGVVTNFEQCKLCGKCADVCPSKAFEMLGSEIALNDLMKTIDNEAIFFDQSGGGVTFSGGEPLLHAPYLLKVLKACGERYYHRVVDTTAFAKTAVLLEVAQHTELFLIDLKHMDDAIHKRFTGVGNEKILSNIVELAKEDCDITFRLPLIKDVNADFENISKTAQFINDLQGDRNRINLLPYHKVAETKYQKLGTKDKFVSFKAPDASEQQKIVDLFKEYGIEATIGG